MTLCTANTPVAVFPFRLLTRSRKVREPSLSFDTTERDSKNDKSLISNRLRRFFLPGKGAHGDAESPFRGARFSATKPADKPVNAKRREPESLGVLRFLPFPQGFTSIREGTSALSFSSESNRGSLATVGVASAPWNFGPKLSRSRSNRGARVYNAVGFGGRNQPPPWLAGRGIGERTPAIRMGIAWSKM